MSPLPQGHTMSVINFNCEYLVNGNRQYKHYYDHQIESPTLALDWHICSWPWHILKVKIKVMHVLTQKSCKRQQIGQTLLMPSNRVLYRVVISIFTFDFGPFYQSMSSIAIEFNCKKFENGVTLHFIVCQRLCCRFLSYMPPNGAIAKCESVKLTYFIKVKILNVNIS